MKKSERTPLNERIARFAVRAENGCLEWTGALNDAGYARMNIDKRNVRVHRLNWELTRGPVPAGVHVLHRCDNRKCIDPLHMFLGSDADNVKDMMAKGRGCIGERQGASKLTLLEVQAIRSLPQHMTHKEVADIFQISFQQVSRIRRGLNWNHVSVLPVTSNI